MLYKETVDPSTLELLSQLQQKDYLKGFFLAGGTALALKIGHRKSMDIDLFSNFSFDTGYVLDRLSADFNFSLFFSANNTLKGSINQIEVDIIAHLYPLVGEPSIIGNISMLAVEDISAMKLNAIAVSGQCVKDFIDIYYLLDNYSVAEMIAFYRQKYSQFNEVNVLKSLAWFDDADLSGWPVLVKNPALTWTAVKKRIVSATREYLKQV
jgi:hypothetical protein